MMVNNVTHTVNKNPFLKSLNNAMNKPTNQDLLKVPKVLDQEIKLWVPV